MRRALLFFLLCSCGPGEPLTFEIKLDALLKDIKELQISIVKNGRSLGGGDCVKVQTDCLVKQTTIDQFVRVQAPNGAEVPAVRFLLANAKDVSINGIPVGKDYALVIEALSKDDPPKLAGSSCDYLAEIGPGLNPRKLAIPITQLTPLKDCDPRVPGSIAPTN